MSCELPRFAAFFPEKMNGPSDPKKRKVHTPNNPCGDATHRTLDAINAVLEKHARQIEALAAANKQLEGRNAALEERCEGLGRKSESLERKCGELEVRCSSLERSIQVLKKDVSRRYSAPDIPRSHWIERGHDEDYADIMEYCLRQIKKDAEAIRTEGNEGNGYYCGCLDYEDQLAILHDDALLPHFQELADAIQLSSGIRQIVFDNIELHPSALGILFPSMEGKVTGIDMQCIRFPGPDVAECYERIATSIRRNHALKKLFWLNNRFPSDEQADLFIESVIENCSIKNVTMENCFDQNGVNGCRALESLMTSGRPFEKLDFDNNALSGIVDVAAALSTNPQIITLSMTGNELNDRDAELIARALKQNTNLRYMFLGNNDITSAGFEKIRMTIYNPSSLKAMESCNHTCYVDCLYWIEVTDYYMGANDDGLTPQQRRRRKLYEMMSSQHAVGSNAHHLNEELG